MNNLYQDMHRFYSVSKTLKFELIPIGKTKENFEKYFLKADEDRSEKFKIVKSYCDKLHKYFIDRCLSDFEKSENESFKEELDKYFLLFKEKKTSSIKENDKKTNDKEINDEFKKIKTKLRKMVSKTFTKDSEYKSLFGENLFDNTKSIGTLSKFFKDDQKKLKDIKMFKGFTTYFGGYDTNRKNMYSDKEKHTAIAYRLIDENLPKYVENVNNFTKKLMRVPELLSELTPDERDYFENVENYIRCLTQDGIEKYNEIIGGKTLSNGVKIQGINEKINFYNQNTKIKQEKLPHLKQLYKQILSDSTSFSFKYDVIENDKDLVDLIKSYYKNIENFLKEDSEFLSALKDISSYDTDRIYINSLSIKKISKDLFDDWEYITSLINDKYKENKNSKEYSIKFIEDLISEYKPELKNKIKEYFKDTVTKLSMEIGSSYEDCKLILDKEYKPNTRLLINDNIAVQNIRIFLDNVKELQNVIKMLMITTEWRDIDDIFYEKLHYDELSEVIPVYNKTRNYLTQKPYSIEKMRLMFDCSSFLNTWNYEKKKFPTYILFVNDKYYLMIATKKNIKKDICVNKNSVAFLYECHKQTTKKGNIPRMFMHSKEGKKSSSIEKYNLPFDDIKDIDPKDIRNKKDLIKLIDYYKECLVKHEDFKIFQLKWKKSEEYESINDFYNDIENQLYLLKKYNIEFNNVKKMVDDNEILLFQIYNKDFSEYSKGTPNLHTIYWKTIFDRDNLNNVVYKLDSKAQMFYRKFSIEEKNKVVHSNNQPIKNKSELNPKKESVFTYDIVKDKRFTVDKFQLHVPIELNPNNKNITNINSIVNASIHQSDNVNIIGIDRGERNLIYVVVIDSNGKILEQMSLNKIINEYKGIEYTTDYHSLLDNKEKERESSRKDWKTIENIKELKEGYMSQVIHKITDLMLKYNAIIVLEYLNKGFTRSRYKIEKQVYDKFETMLINKLSYYVDKNKSKYDEGGLLNAYQLTNYENTKDQSQSGIVFYIPPEYTSTIDPVTGFVNFFSVKSDISIEQSKVFFDKFCNILYNKEENFFEFIVDDYSKFTKKSYGARKDWAICTYGDRIKTFRNLKNDKYESEKVDVTEELKKLFKEYDVDINNDIKKGIMCQTQKEFFKRLIDLFKLTVQMRNYKTGTDIDYIISPVKDKNGNFYDSRKIKDNSLPQDADANGAYNVARKGLMIIEQIKNSKDIDSLELKKIENEDYLNFVQNLNK